MQLIHPVIEYKQTFIAAVKEYQEVESADRKDIYTLNVDDLEKDFSGYLEGLNLESQGINLPEGYVPQSTYWLIDKDEFIGRVSLRHTLTETLLSEGGHIGYDIRPSKRQMGYGTKILELALDKAKEIGLVRVLVTCNENNTSSKKIIEKNGGIFENKVVLHKGKPAKLRYWIDLL